MDLGDQVVDLLKKEFLGELEKGERIMVMVHEGCGCDGDDIDCPGCKGTGFERTVENLFVAGDDDE